MSDIQKFPPNQAEAAWEAFARILDQVKSTQALVTVGLLVDSGQRAFGEVVYVVRAEWAKTMPLSAEEFEQLRKRILRKRPRYD